MDVTGVVLPRTGEFYALEISHSDTEIFQIFLVWSPVNAFQNAVIAVTIGVVPGY
jgi:hypothetical protein